eukprot:gnl/Spiro4/2833_TR1387_c0_g1_i1.p1 gnl/Spiro4/2833_TR1387_c0_g1~~gnl/Spiro4/2833_TR1387_c0_g1_i1.p1  ORF type:complete len:661 (+),score=210.74 gnl/Spiro4/2833_TR1387_c0_g1_i1:71-2053(+)
MSLRPPGRGGATNIKCFMRCRPHNERERGLGQTEVCMDIDAAHNTVTVTKERSEGVFRFDGVFGPDSTQEQIFNSVAAPLIDDVFTGYATCLFCYGQTGSGKSYTLAQLQGTREQVGIIPRAVEQIFARIREEGEHNFEENFVVQIQFVQIYQKEIKDLLDPKCSPEVHLGKLCGAKTVTCATSEDCLRVYRDALDRRIVGRTNMNETSSRSHCCLVVNVTRSPRLDQRTLANDQLTKRGGPQGKRILYGKVTFVDLAGSESVSKSGATGTRFAEAKEINSSLLQLSLVINALANRTHVVYRNSVLTYMLQDSLGGKGRTSVVVTVSPALDNINESLNTIAFGQRARSIEQTAEINQTVDWEAEAVRLQQIVDEQLEQIARLEAARIQAHELETAVQTSEKQMEELQQGVAAVRVAELERQLQDEFVEEILKWNEFVDTFGIGAEVTDDSFEQILLRAQLDADREIEEARNELQRLQTEFTQAKHTGSAPAAASLRHQMEKLTRDTESWQQQLEAELASLQQTERALDCRLRESEYDCVEAFDELVQSNETFGLVLGQLEEKDSSYAQLLQELDRAQLKTSNMLSLLEKNERDAHRVGLESIVIDNENEQLARALNVARLVRPAPHSLPKARPAVSPDRSPSHSPSHSPRGPAIPARPDL